MAETKITVKNNGPLRIAGEFTIYDHEGKAFGLGGADDAFPVPLRIFAEQALLRRESQQGGFPVGDKSPRPSPTRS